MQNLANKRYLHQYFLTLWFLLVGWEFRRFIFPGSVFLTSLSSERCHHMTWHAFLIAPDEPSLTIQHEPLGLLPLLLLLIKISTDTKLVFLDSCLRFYEVCLEKCKHTRVNRWYGIMLMKMYVKCKMHEMYLLETIFVKGISFISRTKFAYIQSLIYTKSITAIE